MTFRADLSAVDFDAVKRVAHEASPALLSDVKMHDVYEVAGAATLTLRFSFLSRERTLTKQELAPETEKIAAALAPLDLIYTIG